MIGININTDERDWIRLILSGAKTVETRGQALPRVCIGTVVALVETHKGRPCRVRGYARVTKRETYTDSNPAVNRRTLVDSQSRYKANRYGYHLAEVVECEPHQPDTVRNIIGYRVIDEEREFNYIQTIKTKTK